MKGLVICVVLMVSSACHAQYPVQLSTRPAPYVQYAQQYEIGAAQWAAPPVVYSGGVYLGELSANRYAPDSVSNPYGVYGSRYSPMSINNPHGPYGRYSPRSIYVYPPYRTLR